MRLIRFGDAGRERPGVLLSDGRRVDLSATFGDWDHDFLHLNGLDALRDMLEETAVSELPPVDADERWGPPVPRPGKIICIGLNYADHAAESGAEVPAEPLLFAKASSAVCGPFDPIIIPRGSTQTDWEVELAVVIGRDARYLDSPAAAAEHIAGYTVAVDVSERDWQKNHCGQWVKGKSSDNFCPLGPVLVTPDEIEDVKALDLRLDVNGQPMQTGHTGRMIFDPLFLVHYISRFMTLEAGDVVSTGTPPGVGMGRQPPRFLQPGDLVEAGIDGIGKQRCTCVSA